MTRRARQGPVDAWVVLVLLVAGSCVPVVTGALFVHIWP